MTSSMMLIGIGGAGCTIARKIANSFDETMRTLLIDTDATSGQENDTFFLLGGERLSGHGAGGNLTNARIAAEESIAQIDAFTENIRIAIIVSCFGGGTGAGATLETIKHLRSRGITTAVFATMPFSFEGEVRARNAQTIKPLVEEEAGTSFIIPLDQIISNNETISGALQNAIYLLSSGITLFWRLIASPGYLRLDAERLRHFLANSKHGRFATITTNGASRAETAIKELLNNPILKSSAPIQSILCGILADDDLRLSEISTIAKAVQNKFGTNATFNLATVNKPSSAFSIVLMIFESSEERNVNVANSFFGTKSKRNILKTGQRTRSTFAKAEQTIVNGEDLDLPTYLRKNIQLDMV